LSLNVIIIIIIIIVIVFIDLLFHMTQLINRSKTKSHRAIRRPIVSED